MSRREFAESVALAALAPLLGTGAGPIHWPAIIQSGTPLGGLARDERSALANALVGVLRVQYGDRLSPADLAVVTRQIELGLERAEKIRTADLANGDEPDFVFSAIRSESPR